MNKIISFGMLKNSCKHLEKEYGVCLPRLYFKERKCTSKYCPIWEKLKEVKAAGVQNGNN